MNNQKTLFEDAGKESQPGLVRESWQMIRHNKKYWLIPLIAGLLGFGILIILGGSSAAPFIYTLF
jgi:hypothetical protein